MNFGGSNKEWENPPAGTHPARVVGIFDIGTQPPFNAGENPKPQVVFLYELVGKAKMSDGRNFTVAKYAGRNNHSNGALVPDVAAITGIVFKQGKMDKQGKGFYYELPDNFTEILKKKVLGAPVFLTLAAKNANGGVRVSAVSQPMEGMNVAQAESPLSWLDFSDSENFASDWQSCPKWIQDKASKSTEMAPPPVAAPAAPKNVAPIGTPINADGPRPHEDDMVF